MDDEGHALFQFGLISSSRLPGADETAAETVARTTRTAAGNISRSPSTNVPLIAAANVAGGALSSPRQPRPHRLLEYGVFLVNHRRRLSQNHRAANLYK
jgi:hypothetical protein